jgi:hypothetical protein
MIEGVGSNAHSRKKNTIDSRTGQTTIDLRGSIEDDKRIEKGIQRAILLRLRTGV